MRGCECYLYVATDGELFKIGVTDDPSAREYGLGSSVKFLKLWQRPYARQLETAIKGVLAYARARGTEWFAVTENEMLREVQRAIRIMDDAQAMKFGRDPSKRPQPGEPAFAPDTASTPIGRRRHTADMCGSNRTTAANPGAAKLHRSRTVERDTVPFTVYNDQSRDRVIEAVRMARRRLEDFADQANAGKVHYSARELKRKIWSAFAEFDALVAE